MSRWIPLLAGAALWAAGVPGSRADDTVAVTVRAGQPGDTINRHVFGQFAEHLGSGIYGGVWVGPGSTIPNTRGIRNDVVAALRALKVPNVRWPGGCFADYYHWRDGIGATRPVTLNPDWGNVVEPNTFGTHEFMDFAAQIGADAYLSINIGSGTPQEAAAWLEYMTSAQPTTLATERAANGRAEPWRVPFLGLGNESWDCGGGMSAAHYVEEMKRYSRFVRNYNPAQQEGDRMLRIAVGPGGDEPRFIAWTEAVMQAWKDHTWAWDIEDLSLHSYTVLDWADKHVATGFGEREYAQILQATLKMEGHIARHAAIMDKYDPEKKIALAVDEWGAWYAPSPGTNPGFLMQQNSLRDAVLAALNLNIFARHADRVRIANIAQMANVLQAMVLTDGARMLRTPTYHVFRLYVPFQEATVLPVQLDAGAWTQDDIRLPRLDALAARGADGQLYVSLTNLDPARPVRVLARIDGAPVRAVTGETLTAARVDSINTFDAPDAVAPKPIAATLDAGTLSVELPPKSVSVFALSPAAGATGAGR